ncbi:MAG TPA: type II secretion system F family protein [Fimbriimonas sp.]|nr:type II secretion system F family protein [Fimbriimonas sp.]
MPFFQYSATDNTGRQVNGTLQAASQDAAMQALRSAGLNGVRFGNQGQLPLTVSRQPHPIATTRPAPTPAKLVQRLPVVPEHQIITPRASDKARFFLFSQFGAMFKAGINPAQGLNDMAQRGGIFAAALGDMAAAAGEGIPLSRVMRKYPRLFPTHASALTEAGEQGGFLPAAFEEISRQAESAHKFGRWFVWAWFVAINALISIPLVLVVTRAMLLSWEKIDKEGGGSGDLGWAMGQIGRAMLEKFLWPWGPVIVLMWAVLYFGRRYVQSDRVTLFRHKIGLRYPVFGARARQENFARFSWTLSHLSRSGVAPARAWHLAAESVPNMAMREVLIRGGNLTGSERLSDLIARSGVFPEEYAHIVATGEMTGNVPAAMEQITKMSTAEFDTATNYVKLRSGVWGCLGLFATSGIVLAILFYFWYHELMGAVLKGFDVP